jgi:hypothetical protein
MRKFLGRDDEVCAKCGTSAPHVRFVRGISSDKPARELEFLRLNCHLCDASWDVLPLDTTEKETK